MESVDELDTYLLSNESWSSDNIYRFGLNMKSYTDESDKYVACQRKQLLKEGIIKPKDTVELISSCINVDWFFFDDFCQIM